MTSIRLCQGQGLWEPGSRRWLIEHWRIGPGVAAVHHRRRGRLAVTPHPLSVETYWLVVPISGIALTSRLGSGFCGRFAIADLP
jgi:hypothetical protein